MSIKTEPHVMYAPPVVYALVEMPDETPEGMVFSHALLGLLEKSYDGKEPIDYLMLGIQRSDSCLISIFRLSTYREIVETVPNVVGANAFIFPLDEIDKEDGVYYFILEGKLDGPQHLSAIGITLSTREVTTGNTIVGMKVKKVVSRPLEDGPMAFTGAMRA